MVFKIPVKSACNFITSLHKIVTSSCYLLQCFRIYSGAPCKKTYRITEL